MGASEVGSPNGAAEPAPQGAAEPAPQGAAEPATSAVVLPSWLSVPPDVALDAVAWDTGDPLPGADDLARAEVFVLPYMAPVEVAALGRHMPRLRFTQTLTAGVEGVAAHLPPGMLLCNAPGVHDASTAELAVGLMIAAQRGIDTAARDMPAGTWRHVRRRSLADSTVVVVGWGGVGRAIGARLAPFEVAVVPVASRARPAHGEQPAVRGIDELDALLPTADIVVLAVPLTALTTGLLDARRLALLPDGALVVNVARGAVVDTDALLAEVASGRLRAALDVTDPEPLPADHPLWRAPGVLITPHLGGNSEAFPARAQAFLDAQLRRYVAGEPLVGRQPQQ